MNRKNVHGFNLLTPPSGRRMLNFLALVISIMPLATFLPGFLKITLPDGARSIWAGANIVFILTGLLLSLVCVRNRDNRSVVSIVSLIISLLWLTILLGIVVLVLFLNL